MMDDRILDFMIVRSNAVQRNERMLQERKLKQRNNGRSDGGRMFQQSYISDQIRSSTIQRQVHLVLFTKTENNLKEEKNCSLLSWWNVSLYLILIISHRNKEDFSTVT